MNTFIYFYLLIQKHLKLYNLLLIDGFKDNICSIKKLISEYKQPRKSSKYNQL